VHSVVSDMAPNYSGNPSMDHDHIMRLVAAVLYLATQPPVLLVTGGTCVCVRVHTLLVTTGGSWVCKVWDGPTRMPFVENTVRPLFTNVHMYKPAASRSGSAEMYIVATGFRS
jgi:23S rRNA (uridine2552-2'-O)-methyltransferase